MAPINNDAEYKEENSEDLENLEEGTAKPEQEGETTEFCTSNEETIYNNDLYGFSIKFPARWSRWKEVKSSYTAPDKIVPGGIIKRIELCSQEACTINIVVYATGEKELKKSGKWIFLGENDRYSFFSYYVTQGGSQREEQLIGIDRRILIDNFQTSIQHCK